MCDQSCLILCGPMDCSPPGCSVHGIFQARILALVAISYSRDLPDPRIQPTYLMFPALAGGLFTTSATREAHTSLQTLGSYHDFSWVSPGGSDCKELACNTGDLALTPGLGRSPGEGNGSPLQRSCLENATDRHLVGYAPWCCKEPDTTERLTHIKIFLILNFLPWETDNSDHLEATLE